MILNKLNLNSKIIFLLLYSLTYSSILLAPNNNSLMPSNYTYFPLSIFFGLTVVIFFLIKSCEKKFKKKPSTIYIFLLIFLIDYLRLRYQIIPFEDFFLTKFIKNNILIFLLFAVIIIYKLRNLLEFLGSASKIFILFFFPYFFIFIFQYCNIYFDIIKKNQLKNENNLVYNKKTIILLFDELDKEILKSEINHLPAFKFIYENSIFYENIQLPGNETFDVVPNIINLKNNEYGFKNNYNSVEYNKYVRNKKNYMQHMYNINQNKKNLFRILNNNNNELFVLGFFHKYCKLFESFGECYDFKYKKLPNYRKLIENIEILSTHKKVYKDLYYYTDYFFASEKLKSAFIHIPYPHPPYIYNPTNKKFEFLNNDVNTGYLGNLYLSDKYLQKILNFKEKKDFDLIILSDHGLRANYKNIINIDNLSYEGVRGRSVMALNLSKDMKKNIVQDRIDITQVLSDYLNNYYEK